jgi:hypothetical protein
MRDPLIRDATQYLTEQSRRLLDGCRMTAHDLTVLYTPDGVGNYAALWTRDFYYMVHSAGDLIPPEHVEACIRYLINTVREDGAAPDRVEAGGRALYVAGPANAPLPARDNLDNPMFLVLLAASHLPRVEEPRRRELLEQWLPPLMRAMDWVPRSERGLVWNDPHNPHSPYGFTDTIAKTGELLMESLLYWQATSDMATMCEIAGSPRACADDYRQRGTQIERNIAQLWDESGAFFAATQDCRQFDIWGCAYAVFIDFPLGDRRQPLLRFLAEHYDQYAWHGQIRHLLRGQYWQRKFADVAPDRYQNGAYWATASGWMIVALEQIDPSLATHTLEALLDDFRAAGIYECVTADYRQLPDYVVSVTNPRGALRRLL